jgi:hypothetical protein
VWDAPSGIVHDDGLSRFWRQRALDVARSLNDLLETWANVFVEKVGLRDGAAPPSRA